LARAVSHWMKSISGGVPGAQHRSNQLVSTELVL
jgi:hypothetical protein